MFYFVILNNRSQHLYLTCFFRNNQVPMYDTCRQIKLFIVPCGRNVRLKVISKFNQNTTAMEFHKSTTILLNSKSQDKFVFKFSNNEMFSSRSSKKIRVSNRSIFPNISIDFVRFS